MTEQELREMSDEELITEYKDIIQARLDIFLENTCQVKEYLTLEPFAKQEILRRMKFPRSIFNFGVDEKTAFDNFNYDTNI